MTFDDTCTRVLDSTLKMPSNGTCSRWLNTTPWQSRSDGCQVFHISNLFLNTFLCLVCVSLNFVYAGYRVVGGCENHLRFVQAHFQPRLACQWGTRFTHRAVVEKAPRQRPQVPWCSERIFLAELSQCVVPDSRFLQWWQPEVNRPPSFCCHLNLSYFVLNWSIYGIELFTPLVVWWLQACGIKYTKKQGKLEKNIFFYVWSIFSHKLSLRPPKKWVRTAESQFGAYA